jgi:hypothetical protein
MFMLETINYFFYAKNLQFFGVKREKLVFVKKKEKN